MIIAKRLALPMAPIDRNDWRRIRATAVALLASVLLAACGGGAPTTELPIAPGGGNNSGNALYTGPVAETADVLKFQQEFWSNVRTADRCGGCHNENVGRNPMFARSDDVNEAYAIAVNHVDTEQPALSELVARTSTGHGCWAGEDQGGVCATIMTTWIERWVGETAGGGRQIILLPPENSNEPGNSKSFPETSASFASLIHTPILQPYCSDCHSSEAEVQLVQPYHADPDVDSAYDAAKPKINLDAPANSRLVLKLRNEGHNCWEVDAIPGVDCGQSAQIMEDAITDFADFDPTPVNPLLITSKAIRLVDGTVASGGNRFEDVQVALWEFKEGEGSRVANDTSGVDPAIDLNLSPEVTWFGGWGITMNGGRAQGLTAPSKKLYDVLQEAGEFSIEAWVVPANVTQEEARIVTYSTNDQSSNFALQQNLYDYQFRLRMGLDSAGNPTTNNNGIPAVSTPAAAEVLQATLQHVVATFNPVEGRKIFVNGELVSQVDPTASGTFAPWQDTFALVLGADANGAGPWEGTIRLASIHRRALTTDQVMQNFDAGVGEKFFMLFDISAEISAQPESSFILFEAQQYDSYAYLFDRPHFITLDGSAPSGIQIEGMRVAMNGVEVPVGQTYATLTGVLDANQFEELGQPLSVLGAVLPLEKGAESDEFFLTFDNLDGVGFDRDPDPTLVVTENDLPPAPRIGVKTFDEIDSTFAAVTRIDRTDYPDTVEATYQELRQSLPAVEDINTFLSSHQVAIAQLAISYCDALINVDGNPDGNGTMFPGFNFDAPRLTAFSLTNRGTFVDPLIDTIMGTGIGTQPVRADVYAELASYTAAGGDRPDNLIDRLLIPISPETGLPPVDPITGAPIPPSNTRGIAKGVCAAMLGNAVTLIQ